MHSYGPFRPPVGESVQYCASDAGPYRPALILRIHDDDRHSADLVTFRDEGTDVKAEMEYRVPRDDRGHAIGPHYRRLR